MTRDTLTDRQWEHLRPVLPPQKPVTARRAIDRRLILNAILWVLRTGAPESHAVVVDLKPHAQDIVNLYIMRGIVGYSYAEWTPLCFLFERLFDNQSEPDPEHFKQGFTREEGSRGIHAVSFVYLRRGTQGGKAWNWGHIGRVNGAILFPDAWRYFDQEIRSLGWLD